MIKRDVVGTRGLGFGLFLIKSLLNFKNGLFLLIRFFIFTNIKFTRFKKTVRVVLLMPF